MVSTIIKKIQYTPLYSNWVFCWCIMLEICYNDKQDWRFLQQFSHFSPVSNCIVLMSEQVLWQLENSCIILGIHSLQSCLSPLNGNYPLAQGTHCSHECNLTVHVHKKKSVFTDHPRYDVIRTSTGSSSHNHDVPLKHPNCDRDRYMISPDSTKWHGVDNTALFPIRTRQVTTLLIY